MLRGWQSRESDIWAEIRRGKAFQEEGTASAKVLRQEAEKEAALGLEQREPQELLDSASPAFLWLVW